MVCATKRSRSFAQFIPDLITNSTKIAARYHLEINVATGASMRQPKAYSNGSPAEQAYCPPAPARSKASALGARPDHEGLIGVFRDLPPQVAVIAELRLRLQDLLEIRVGRRCLGVDFVRGF